MMKRHGYPLSICGALAIAACSSANKDWESASAENTLFGYQTFLDRHPSDQHAEEARISMAALQDDSDWIRAQNGNSLGSYQQYLQAEPNGTYAHSARDQIAGLERASAWKTARSAESATALQGLLQKYPQGTEADQARQKLAGLQTVYQAELGSFHDERAAKHRRSELRSRFSGVLEEVDVVSPDSSNKRYRVMSGIMDLHDADSTCASLKRDHQTCEVVSANQGQS